MDTNDLQKIMNRFDQTMNRFDRIEELLNRRGSKQPVDRESSRDLLRERVDTVETLFWRIINSPRDLRKNSYKFPKCLLEGIFEVPNEAMVYSVLVNQAATRKAFKTRGEGDPRGASPHDLVRAAIDKSNLIILPISDTSLDSFSTTVAAFSPGEAIRVAKTTAKLPVAFLGWTTTSRAISKKGLNGIMLPVLSDPCGIRKWDGDEEEELGQVEELLALRQKSYEESYEEEPSKPEEVRPVRERKVWTLNLGLGDEEDEEPDELPPTEETLLDTEESDGDREERLDLERAKKPSSKLNITVRRTKQ